MIGTTIEWYDYYIFGTAAVLVINDQFFPDLSPAAGTLASLATFSVAFIARPFGGIIFGHFGDKVSRKTILVWSLMLMGVSTFLVGFLPNYAAIGIWAPILLVALRFLQGLAVGGEWGGAVLMALEHAPQNKKAFYASWTQSGVPAALVLSSTIFLFMQMMDEPAFHSWGWRVPFWISAALIVVGLFIRLRITESPEFLEMKADKREVRIPLFELLRTAWWPLLLGIFTLASPNIIFYISSVYLLSYGPDHAGLSRDAVFVALIVASSLAVFTIPLVAVIADRVGKKKIMLTGAVMVALFIFPVFWLVDTGQPLGALVAMILALPIAHATAYAVVASFIPELFQPEVRFTGSSLAYQIGGIVTSAPAPVIAASLIQNTGSSMSIALYVSIAALVGFVAIALSRKHQEPTPQMSTEPAVGGSVGR
ncbi:MFS transporter [Brevibacterium sp. VCM10]|uniref:MFS transporter n=1 Tax=Brevibacterium sp. VCM10 TaxID=1381751 RepID=UPI0018CC2F9C|nr:MFS transporter [Brevibacterium sp. VCM10]